jgi:hypothetical protein
MIVIAEGIVLGEPMRGIDLLLGIGARAMESREAYMLGNGKSFLIYNEIEPVEKVYERINAITRDQIAEIANDIFGRTSTLIYK